MARAALADITVIDFTRVRAGPWCTQLLDRMGADVIKIERPGAGDLSRGSHPAVDGTGADFISKNRNKRSIELNLKSSEGQKLARDLIADADVLVENYSPGVMASFGLDYEYLAEHVNPGLIYGSITGWGEDGPYQDKKGVDLVMQGEGGIMSVTGPEGGPPVKVGQAIGDIGAGLYMTMGILAALHHRHETGEGQKVSTNLFGTITSIMDEYVTMYGMTGEDPQPRGARHQTAVPYEMVETKDGRMIISVIGGGGWETFVTEVLDEESLLEYDSNELREQHYDEVMGVVRPKMREKGTDEWIEIFEDLGFPAGHFNRVSDVVDHPQARALGYVGRFEDEDLGEVLVPGYPLHFSEFETAHDEFVPGLGEHTEAVLSEELGLSAERIAELAEDDVIG